MVSKEVCQGYFQKYIKIFVSAVLFRFGRSSFVQIQ